MSFRTDVRNLPRPIRFLTQNLVRNDSGDIGTVQYERTSKNSMAESLA